MTEMSEAVHPDRIPTHPGALLREDVFPALGMTVTDIAKALKVTRQQLHRILAEDSGVSAEMAHRLGRFLGNGPELWVDMQTAYDLAVAKSRLGSSLDDIRAFEPDGPFTSASAPNSPGRE
jgi:addiction module HigA family antidote